MLFFQLFDENEVSKLEWIPLKRWKSEIDRYKSVYGPANTEAR